MSAYEQRVEEADSKFQYLLFAAEPYETIGFKVPNLEVDKTDNKFIEHWNPKKKLYTVQVFFKQREAKALPSLSHKPQSFLPIGARF